MWRTNSDEPRATITSMRPCRPSTAATSSRPSSSTAARGSIPAASEHAVDDRGQRPVRPQRLAPALEQDGVAALPGEADDLDERVGPRLEDHAEQAERRADALEHQPVVQLAPQRRPPDQIGHRGELIQPVAHAVELAGVQAEPLHQRRGDVLRLGALQILPVRGEHLRAHARLAQRRGQRAQQLRAPLAPEPRELAARGLGRQRPSPASRLQLRRRSWCSSDGSHHQVVARDQRVVAAPAEDGVDLLAVTPGQLAARVGRVVDEAAPVHAAAAVADLDDVALVERPLDADDADRQQRRLLRAQRLAARRR